MNNTAVDAEKRFQASAPVIQITLAIMADWAEEQGVDLGDPMEACEVVWGTMYGMASLGQIGTIGFPRAAHLADRALRALMLAWRSGQLDKPTGAHGAPEEPEARG
jgi:hypothetical protein